MTFYSSVLYYFLLIYNIISLVLGILAIIACVFELDNFSQDVAQYTEDIVQLVAACGLVISAFIGCGGVTFNSIYSLGIYLTFLVFLIITHIWKLLRYDEIALEDAIRSEVTFAWVQAVENKPATMHKLQHKYECCGVDGMKDYINLNLDSQKKYCYSDVGQKNQNGTQYIGGCVEAMQSYCLDIYRIERLVHFIMFGYEVTGALLTSLFIWQLFNKTRRYFY